MGKASAQAGRVDEGEAFNLQRDLLNLARLSDRETAILGGAYVETLLQGLLAQKMPGLNRGSTLSRTLFNSAGGALQTFGAKIQIAEAFGVVDVETARALRALKAIRNDFAHSHANIRAESASLHKHIAVLNGWRDGQARADAVVEAKGWSQFVDFDSDHLQPAEVRRSVADSAGIAMADSGQVVFLLPLARDVADAKSGLIYAVWEMAWFFLCLGMWEGPGSPRIEIFIPRLLSRR